MRAVDPTTGCTVRRAVGAGWAAVQVMRAGCAEDTAVVAAAQDGRLSPERPGDGQGAGSGAKHVVRSLARNCDFETDLGCSILWPPGSERRKEDMAAVWECTE